MPYYVYILSNKAGTVLYTGVTNNLVRRTHEHRESRTAGFTSRYKVNRLVYYADSKDIVTAIEAEKRIKGGSRQGKLDLINSMNPHWIDLCGSIIG
jgi:putative endonuclease